EASLTELDYFEIVHTQTLEPITDINSVSGAVACIAVVVGRIRLIDNIILK
ncbi:MAG: pantoate--beta-alanine ligase, partial [Bacteroidia bacterium]|nr:pantoate--beta-alanine ligase [Bacteroidia bacterium]